MTEKNKEHSEISEINWIDDAFRVYKTRFGMWHSSTKDGKPIIGSLTEQHCIDATRFYLKGMQEGWEESNDRVMNDGIVGGKL
jgi:hypothetical protein